MAITAAQLKAARARLNWSQDDVANVVGVDVLTIVGFENGKRKPDSRTLVDIQIALEAAGADLKSLDGSKVSATRVGRRPISDGAAIPPIPPNDSYDGSPV
jgi:transcriptional regulator with XRE-family HTH domain